MSGAEQRRAMIIAGVVRFARVVGVLVGGTASLAVVVGLIAGTPISRTLSVGLYVLGAVMLVAGFFLGNRGPVRIEETFGRSGVRDHRRLHWSPPEERIETINSSALFVTGGLVVLLLGVLVDGRYPLI